MGELYSSGFGFQHILSAESVDLGSHRQRCDHMRTHSEGRLGERCPATFERGVTNMQKGASSAGECPGCLAGHVEAGTG